MSNRYTEAEEVYSLDQWNEILNAWGCCPMPFVSSPFRNNQTAVSPALSKLAYLPFINPGASEDDDVPTLYETLDTEVGDPTVEGTRGQAFSAEGIIDPGGDDIPFSITAWYEETHGPDGVTVEFIGYYSQYVGPPGSEIWDTDDWPLEDWTLDLLTPGDPGPDEYECAATTITKTPGIAEIVQGSPAPQPDAGGAPWGNSNSVWADYRERAGIETSELSDSFTRSSLWSEAITELDSAPWANAGSANAAYLLDTWPVAGDYFDYWDQDCEEKWGAYETTSASASAVKLRFRWTVPSGGASIVIGNYYKITWDVIEEPIGWDADPPTATRTFYQEGQEWVWTEGEDTESPWFEVPPPEEPGYRRVVNVRWQGAPDGIVPYGVLPQWQGEKITLPDPAPTP